MAKSGQNFTRFSSNNPFAVSEATTKKSVLDWLDQPLIDTRSVATRKINQMAPELIDPFKLLRKASTAVKIDALLL